MRNQLPVVNSDHGHPERPLIGAIRGLTAPVLTPSYGGWQEYQTLSICQNSARLFLITRLLRRSSYWNTLASALRREIFSSMTHLSPDTKMTIPASLNFQLGTGLWANIPQPPVAYFCANTLHRQRNSFVNRRLMMIASN